MANIGPNEGRRLRMAFSRFTAMLIEEAQDFTGLSYEKLDQAFGFAPGRCTQYARYPVRKKTRAPQADELQNLENLVARLLLRPAHVLKIENLALLTIDDPTKNIVVGEPDLNLDFRTFQQVDFVITYEDDWPTYRRLKYDPMTLLTGQSLVALYAWLWGILYDRQMLPEHFADMLGHLTGKIALETAIPNLMARAKAERRSIEAAGILPETHGEHA